MLYALVMYVCASAEPCKPEEAESAVVRKNMTMEECANNGPALTALLAQGKYFVMRCRLDPTQRHN